MKKQEHRKDTGEKNRSSEYVLAYRNTKPNRVRPKTPPTPPKPKVEPVIFYMEHEDFFTIHDDTI